MLGRPLFLKIMAREVKGGRKGSLLHREGVRANGDDGLRRSPKKCLRQDLFPVDHKRRTIANKIHRKKHMTRAEVYNRISENRVPQCCPKNAAATRDNDGSLGE